MAEQEGLKKLLLEQCENIDDGYEEILKGVLDAGTRQKVYKKQIENLKLWVRLCSEK